MRIIVPLVLCSIELAGQKRVQDARVALDERAPFVGIVFDRVGYREPTRKGETNRGLWLKLRNNCVVPIRVGVLPIASARQGDRVLVAHAVVEEERDVRTLAQPERPKVRIPRPDGYSTTDVPHWREIPSGRDLPFSVPLAHLTREWHIRIEFFLITKYGPGGKQPRTFVEFYWTDLPDEARKESDRTLYAENAQ